ncbi:hypothetical protein V6N11_059016 [Hibiscus sabdariffa]|uniref:Uncharacterized protein n=1 Tax=Hibiscus sabdariffa TaxID=183260 RepID=A0ABR2U6R1_9ROSI
MALQDTQDSFWRKKHSDDKRTNIELSQNHLDQRNAQKQYPKLPLKLVEGAIDGDKLDILHNFAIGFCRHPYRLRDLVKEFRDAKCEGLTTMRIVGSLVLLIDKVFPIRVVEMEEAIDPKCDCCCGIDVGSAGDDTDVASSSGLDSTVLAKSTTKLTPNSSHLDQIQLSWMVDEEIGFVTRPMDDRDNSDVMTLVSQDVPLHDQNVQELDLVDGQLRGDDQSIPLT